MIRDLERSSILKVSKQEIASLLNQKANVDDVSWTFSEAAINIESRTTFDDVQKMINEWMWGVGSYDEKSSSWGEIMSLWNEIQ